MTKAESEPRTASLQNAITEVKQKCAKNHMLTVSEKKRKWVLYGDRASKGQTWTLNSDLTQKPSVNKITKGKGERTVKYRRLREHGT